MSKAGPDLKFFRQRLIALRDELAGLEQAGEDAAQTVELDQTRMGRLSRMDALQAQAMSQAANRRREVSLRAIAAALKRIDEGDYGECHECSEYINPLRLEADPTARYCIGCAGEREAP